MNNKEENKYVTYGISHIQDGDMRSCENRKAFLQTIQIEAKDLIRARLEHGSTIKIINDKNRDKEIICDGLITNSNKYILAITVADCLPIYFYDPIRKISAIAHAGWQGLEKNIIAKMLSIYKQHFHSHLQDIQIIIGPHIQQCHFEVQKDFLKRFTKYQASYKDKKKYFIKLSEIATKQLIKNGAKAPNIIISNECSYCLKEKYHSYRREGKDQFKIMLAYISLK